MTDDKYETGSIIEMLPIDKRPDLDRGSFRTLVDTVLNEWGFFREVDYEQSEDGDLVWGDYAGVGGQSIEATFLGDNIGDHVTYDHMGSEDVMDSYLAKPGETSDAALIFDNVPCQKIMNIADDFSDRLCA
jgi:hypothetical protein